MIRVGTGSKRWYLHRALRSKGKVEYPKLSSLPSCLRPLPRCLAHLYWVRPNICLSGYTSPTWPLQQPQQFTFAFSSFYSVAAKGCITPSNDLTEVRELGRMDSSSNPNVSGYVIQGKTCLWKMVIGLEIHAQVTAETKLFSRASAAFGDIPNHNVSIIDVALPGALPVINSKCVDQAIKTGLAIKGRINLHSVFDRKHYFYCDLPSGYQITQWKHPIVSDGHIIISLPDYERKMVAIERIQLETDSGKSLHDQHAFYTFVDLNRAGCALMEIVTGPDMSSPVEAGAFVRKLQLLLKYIGVCDGNMEEGSLRCDANVSVQRMDSNELGVRCEIKNLNSIKGVMRAIEYEAHRHVKLLEDGGRVEQQTRFFDPIRRVTSIGRKKEDQIDYRFFPDPDLPSLILDPEHIVNIASSIPELPDEAYNRLLRDYRLERYGATVISNYIGAVHYFEQVAKGRVAKEVANWITNELFGHLKGGDILECPISPQKLGELLDMISSGAISARIAKDVIEMKFKGDGRTPKEIVQEEGLKQVNDEKSLNELCYTIVSHNPREVKEYRAGKERMMKYFVGQVMKATNGQAPGPVVTHIFHRIIMEDDVSPMNNPE